MSTRAQTKLATDLLQKMEIAYRIDEESIANKQPAVAKLNILATVERVLSLKALWHTLLGAVLALSHPLSLSLTLSPAPAITSGSLLFLLGGP